MNQRDKNPGNGLVVDLAFGRTSWSYRVQAKGLFIYSLV